jgi:hypothetical protein
MLELREVAEMRMPTLTVYVDFNVLLGDEGESRAFELVGKLKDLLG